MEGHQCFHPLGEDIYQLELPSLWESDFMSLDNGFYYRFIAEDAMTSCWKLETEFGDVMQAGYHYKYDFEWDGSLLITHFDSVNRQRACSVGTAFIVVVDEVKCEYLLYAYICPLKQKCESIHVLDICDVSSESKLIINDVCIDLHVNVI